MPPYISFVFILLVACQGVLMEIGGKYSVPRIDWEDNENCQLNFPSS
ncbi:hypothetical protein LSO9J_80025 [Candidatus Liberibacter solanacearum]